MQPLSHLRAVELTNDIAAAYAGRLLAAGGADVICLEAASGSPLRQREPVVTAPNGKRVSMVWEYVAANKRSSAYGAEGPGPSTQRLLADADVFITDWRPAELADEGLDPEALSAANPSLVVLTVTPFGRRGPYADFAGSEIVIESLAGYLHTNGIADRYPIKAAGYQALYTAGLHGFIGALGGLQERRRSGRGQVVEVSCLEAFISVLPLLRGEFSGHDAVRVEGTLPGFYIFACKDGYVTLPPSMRSRNIGQLAKVLGADPDHLPASLSEENISTIAMRRFIEDQTMKMTVREVYDAFGQTRTMCEIIHSPLDLVNSEHLAERGYFWEIDHSSLGKIKFPGPAAKLSGTPFEPPAPAPPMPAAETATWARERVPPPAGAADYRPGPPLDGIRVIDMTGGWAGPYATMLLADLGADVIKIEAMSRPDSWRGMGTGPLPPNAEPAQLHLSSNPANPYAHRLSTSGSYNAVNRGKRSVCLDLKTDAGREAYLGLVPGTDLVIDNFSAGAMDRMGLGLDVLSKLSPNLCMLSFSGFGATGTYKHRRANGPIIEAACGWSAVAGYEDGVPSMMGIGVADSLSGLSLAAHSMLLLEARERLGGAQLAEGSMLESCMQYMGDEILLAAVTGKDPRRIGNRDRQYAPQGIFPSKGDDAWVAISVRDDADWRQLAGLPGMAETGLANPRFATAEARREANAEIEERLGRWTAARTSREAMFALQHVGVPAGSVHRCSGALNDEHLAAKGWFIRMTHPDMGTHRYNGFAWHFMRTPGVARWTSPRLGEHSVEVLSSRLGYDNNRIREMFLAGVSGSLLTREPESETVGEPA